MRLRGFSQRAELKTEEKRTAGEGGEDVGGLCAQLGLDGLQSGPVDVWDRERQGRVVQAFKQAGAVMSTLAGVRGVRAYVCRKSASWASAILAHGLPITTFFSRFSVGRSMSLGLG